MFFLVLFGGLSIGDVLINVPLLFLYILELRQHLGSNGPHIEFGHHFLHLLNSHS
jgi:hypothetical protein